MLEEDFVYAVSPIRAMRNELDELRKENERLREENEKLRQALQDPDIH